MTGKRRKALPPLPREVRLPAGPYKVVRAEIPPDKGQRSDAANWGECDFESRTITITPGLARTVAHLTLRHEIVHAILFDAGVKLREVQEEHVADALAAYHVYEMQQP